MYSTNRYRLLILTIFLALTFWPHNEASAIPAFARQYQLSCITCHAAFPRLNEFGENFRDSNFRLPNWKDTTLKTGDDELALPAYVPLALRTQAYVQGRDAESVDPESGEVIEADSDFQAPYLIKLLSSAPLSDNISYYFYGIFAEKGGNGTTVIEDAWFSYADILGSRVDMMLGQFQVSDLMFARETRMTFQDFMTYRMAGITYDRGILFSRGFGNLDLALGLVNGNGIEENFTINSPGYIRPDHMFDNDNSKSAFLRLGADFKWLSAGLFGYAGNQKNATGSAGTESGDRDTDKSIVGVDLKSKVGAKTYVFAQFLWNEWDGFIDPNITYRWFGMFAGIDYITGKKWTYSLLYNYADANDLDNTDTIYEGIDINSLTLNASYYFMRNVKGTVELNYDFLDAVPQSGVFYTGHLTQENYILLGFDAAF